MIWLERQVNVFNILTIKAQAKYLIKSFTCCYIQIFVYAIQDIYGLYTHLFVKLDNEMGNL